MTRGAPADGPAAADAAAFLARDETSFIHGSIGAVDAGPPASLVIGAATS